MPFLLNYRPVTQKKLLTMYETPAPFHRLFYSGQGICNSLNILVFIYFREKKGRYLTDV